MRISTVLLAVLCVTLCSCERSPQITLGGVGDDPLIWISPDETRRIGFQLLTNRYPQAHLVSEQGAGPIWTYHFGTNGTVLPLSVVVDRRTGKAEFQRVVR